MDTPHRPKPALVRARHLVGACMALLVLSAVFIPAQAGPTQRPPVAMAASGTHAAAMDGPCPPPGDCCPPEIPQCCPGRVPPNHCCGTQFNPTGDPAQCCSLYPTVQNCCTLGSPSFSPLGCVCALTGVCVTAAAPDGAAQPALAAAAALQADAQPPAPPERAPLALAGHAAA